VKASQILKLAFGLMIFAWMAGSGRVNVHQVVGTLLHWQAVLVMLCLLSIQPCVTAWRWSLLLEEVRLPYRRAYGLTMIGLLFNSEIPGAVGGDLLKGYYVVRATRGRKSSVASSIVMDRVLGILGLICLSLLMAAANFRELVHNHATRSLGALLVTGLISGLAALYIGGLAGPGLSELGFLPAVVRKACRSLSEYYKKPSVMLIAVAVSVLSHVFPCMAYYVALRTVGIVEDVSLASFFLLMPPGFAAN